MWLESSKHRVRSRTWMAYLAHCRLYLIPTFAHRRTRDITPHEIESALIGWRGRRKDREAKQLSPRSVVHIFRTLRTIYRWAVRKGLLSTDPTQYVDPPRTPQREMRTLSPAALADLLEAARGTDLLAPIATAVGTGLRRGELLGLRWSDIDLTSGRLTVLRALEVVRDEHVAEDGSVTYSYATREKPPKTVGSRRTISLAPSVVAVLERARFEQRERRFQYGLRRDEDSYVFDCGDCTPWEPGRFSSAFAKLVKSARLPHVRLHDLRHSYASLSLQAGVDLKTISMSLGHTDIGTTANLYAHVTETLQARHAERIESIMGSALAAAIAGGERIVAPGKSNVSHKSVTRAKKARGCGLSLVAPTGIESVWTWLTLADGSEGRMKSGSSPG